MHKLMHQHLTHHIAQLVGTHA